MTPQSAISELVTSKQILLPFDLIILQKSENYSLVSRLSILKEN